MGGVGWGGGGVGGKNNGGLLDWVEIWVDWEWGVSWGGDEFWGR